MTGASLARAAAEPAAHPASPRAFVAQVLERVAGREVTAVIAVPAPEVLPDALLDTTELDHAVLWSPPSGSSLAGIGVCHRVGLDGASRFATLRAEAERIFGRLETVDHPSCRPSVPRLFGGLAFAPGASNASPWRAFGDGCFTLPRWTYERSEAGASLRLAVRGESLDGTSRDACLRELDTMLERLTSHRHRPLVASPSVPRRVVPPPRARWSAQVEAIRQAIATGRVRKVVAADRSIVELDRPLDPLTVLARLADRAGDSRQTRFAFGRDGATFVGSTPERLIARRGLSIATEALAGSTEVGVGFARRLLASAKDRQEHDLVVESIRRRLEPLCAELDVASEPRVRAWREVQHLQTPIVGTLRAPRHVLDLVELLHPTPAVGGVPTEEAVRWIVEHEQTARGWYAGPVGWLDARGDGELWVALRSCVIASSRAHLYAGAGIVADSNPELEYVETELKKQSLLSALGVGATAAAG